MMSEHYFPKSGAKLLHQTVKTCQYVKKNTLFLQKSVFLYIDGICTMYQLYIYSSVQRRDRLMKIES